MTDEFKRKLPNKFMPKSNQDYTARMSQPSRYDAGYDCELPPEVRTELNRPKRPRILGWSKTVALEPALKARLYLLLLIAALLIGGAASNLWRQSRIFGDQESQKAERTKTSKAILQPTPAQEPTPQAVPTPEHPPYHDWKSYLAAHQTRAPRAALVKLPPPTAQLVRLPEWKLGETRPVTMPCNLEVLATYRGQLQSQDMLPLSGNQLGDTWVVGDTPWVWIRAPGATRADRIGP